VTFDLDISYVGSLSGSRSKVKVTGQRSRSLEENKSSATAKGSDALESFLSKVAFESDFRNKSCTRVMKTFALFLLSKETFTIRTRSVLASFFRELLSKATFERKTF